MLIQLWTSFDFVVIIFSSVKEGVDAVVTEVEAIVNKQYSFAIMLTELSAAIEMQAKEQETQRKKVFLCFS